MKQIDIKYHFNIYTIFDKEIELVKIDRYFQSSWYIDQSYYLKEF